MLGRADGCRSARVYTQVHLVGHRVQAPASRHPSLESPAEHRVQPTVQTLLDRSELALALLTPAGDLPAGRARRPGAVGAHVRPRRSHAVPRRAGTCCSPPARSSRRRGRGGDAGDADGTARPPADFADAYVRRLREAGVAALGFGTEVVRAGTPEALVEACTRAGAAARRGALPGAVHRDRPARRRPARRGRVRPPGLGARRAARHLARRPAPRRALGHARRAVAPARRVGRPRRRVGVARPRGAGRRTRAARARRGRRRGALDAAARPASQPHPGRGRRPWASRSASPCRPSARAAPCAGCSRSATPPSSTRPAARSSTPSSRSPGSRSSRTARSTGREGTCGPGLLRGILAGDTELADARGRRDVGRRFPLRRCAMR